MANPKVTVIGGQAAPSLSQSGLDDNKPSSPAAKPTVIGGGGLPSSSEQTAPAAPGMKPKAFRPTPILGAEPQEARPAESPATRPALTPKVLQSTSAPAAPVAAAAPIVPSALPGTQRRPLAVTAEELEQAFPKYSAQDRNVAQGVLSGFSLEAANPSTILAFEKGPQEELTTIAKERLAIAQRPGVRYVVQHLNRLQVLLQEVLDSFEGGFLRKSPEKVWQMHSSEVQQIEQLLDDADDKLAAELGELATMKSRCESCQKGLGGAALAADFLVARLREDMASLMLSRLASITASQALVIEQINLIDRDAEQLQELTLLVQDGVVLRLPAIYAQLTALGGRINDTDRFHAVERLNAILNPLKARKLP